jgi:hypothetical protein
MWLLAVAATWKIHPVDFNAVGGLRFALRRVKQVT